MARTCRRLYEETLGRVLPMDVERMTIDQCLVICLDGAALGMGGNTVSESEAVAKGYIEPGQKTAYQLAQEAEEARLAKMTQDAKVSKRRRRREAANG